MAASIIDGKAVASDIRSKVAAEVQEFVRTHGFPPGLAVVIVGDDPASRVYVDGKKRACQALGMYSEEHALPATATQTELLDLVGRLNANRRIHGVLVQSPLPGHLDEGEVIEAIDPRKDVDGFHPINVGRLVTGSPDTFVPCTPAGILELIRRTGTELKGKRAVVVGRSNIVGKPVAMLLLAEHATVTICHSRTRDLSAVCREADVLVVAVGKPELIDASHVKAGAIVIDVGMNEIGTTASGRRRLVGDVKFESVAEVAGWITPVPGGVGPMTIAMLMCNTLAAARRQAQ